MHRESMRHKSVLGVLGFTGGMITSISLLTMDRPLQSAIGYAGTLCFVMYTGVQCERHATIADAYDKLHKNMPTEDPVVYEKFAQLEITEPWIPPWIRWSVESKFKSNKFIGQSTK
jgi:hypothetical protein